MTTTIYCNGRAMQVYSFDDETTILQRYSLTVPNSLPEYFRVKEEEYKIEPGLKLNIADIRKEIGGEMNLEIVTLLQEKYQIDSRTIIILWLLKGYKEEEQLVTQIYPINSDFFSLAAIRDAVNSYPGEIDVKIKDIREKINNLDKLFKELNSESPVNTGELNIDSYTSSIVLKSPDDLLDIFNFLSVSERIPFIAIKTDEKSMYKLLKEFDLSPDWIDLDDKAVYVKLLEKRKVYTDLIWYPNNVLELKYHFQSDKTEDELWSYFKSSIGDRISYSILSEPKRRKIRTSFNITYKRFNKGVFYDLVMNDPLLSKFFFLREGEKSAMTKDQIHAYYQTSTKPVRFSLVNLDKNGCQVRVGEANNLLQVESLKQVVSRAFTILDKKYDEVVKLYKKIIPNFLVISAVKTKEVKIDKKTSERLLNLQQDLPELFKDTGSGDNSYPKSCSSAFQPIILSDDEVIPHIEKKKGINLETGFFHVLRYPLYGKYARWYACDRDGLFPAIKVNNGANAEEFPYIPCCGKTNYKTKTTPGYRKYLESYGEVKNTDNSLLNDFIQILVKNGFKIGSKLEGQTKSLGKGKSYKVQPIKVAEPGREGILPRNLQRMMGEDAFRYGVEMKPDSFLYCLLTATDNKFRSLKADKKSKMVREIRESIVDFSPGRQELFGYTDDQLLGIMAGNDYIDPRMWISVVSHRFNVNIFLYEWNDNLYHGEIVIPRYDKVYLYPGLKDRPTVFIIMYSMSRGYPYQCNLIKLNDKFAITDPVVVSKAEKLFRSSYRVRYLSPNLSETIEINEKEIPDIELLNYTTEKVLKECLMEGIKSQVIDQLGKTRMIIYSDFSIITPPLAPLENIPESKDMIRGDIAEVLKFIKQRKMTILAQAGNEESIQGLWVRLYNNMGYIPLQTTAPLVDVDFTQNEPDRASKKSKLSELQLKERIAWILKTFVLRMYAQGKHTENSYVVRENHQYDLTKLRHRFDDNDFLFENGKLIVPSLEVSKRLNAYLKVQLLNDTPGVLKYNLMTFIPGYYQSRLNFQISPNEMLFTSEKEIEEWLKENAETCTPKVHYEVQMNKREPYFYLNYNLGNKVAIIQNVEENVLNRALSVSYKWVKERHNLGYNAQINPEVNRQSYVIYSQDGEVKRRPPSVEKPQLAVIQYDKGKFAAYLPLEK